MYSETRELTFAIGGRNRMISMGYFFRFIYQNAVGGRAKGLARWWLPAYPELDPDLTIYSGGQGKGAQNHTRFCHADMIGRRVLRDAVPVADLLSRRDPNVRRAIVALVQQVVSEPDIAA
jgi:hypothetical protein